MKLLRGKNWFEFQFDKKGYKSVYIGPFYFQDKDVQGRYRYKILSFMTRRFKLRFIKDRETKKWEFSFAGLWNSEGKTNQYINYNIRVSEFVNIE
jgi:hypothetical protein